MNDRCLIHVCSYTLLVKTAIQNHTDQLIGLQCIIARYFFQSGDWNWLGNDFSKHYGRELEIARHEH
jgi:hypothetical protein